MSRINKNPKRLVPGVEFILGVSMLKNENWSRQVF
jgi:hypothetical protein